MYRKAIRITAPINAHPLFRWRWMALVIPGVRQIFLMVVVVVLCGFAIYLPTHQVSQIDTTIYAMVEGFVVSLFVGFFLFLSQNLTIEIQQTKARILLYESNMLFALLLNVMALLIWVDSKPHVIGWLPLIFSLAYLLYAIWQVLQLSIDMSRFETARENFLLAIMTRAAVDMLELYIQSSRMFTHEFKQYYNDNPYIEIRPRVNQSTNYVQFRSPKSGYVVNINQSPLHTLYTDICRDYSDLTYDTITEPLIILHQTLSSDRNTEYESNQYLKDRVSVGDVLFEVRKDVVDRYTMQYFNCLKSTLFTISITSPASVARSEIAILKNQCIYDLDTGNVTSFDSNILLYLHVLRNAYYESQQVYFFFTAQYQSNTSILDDTQLIDWILADLNEIMMLQDNKDTMRGLGVARQLGALGWEIGSSRIIKSVMTYYCNVYARAMAKFGSTVIAGRIAQNAIDTIHNLTKSHEEFILNRRRFRYYHEILNPICDAYRCFMVTSLFHGITQKFALVFDMSKTMYVEIPSSDENESKWPPDIAREMREQRDALNSVSLDVGGWLLQYLALNPPDIQDKRADLITALNHMIEHIASTVPTHQLLSLYGDLRQTKTNMQIDLTGLYEAYGFFLLSHREDSLDQFIILVLVRQSVTNMLTNDKRLFNFNPNLFPFLYTAIKDMYTDIARWSQYSQLVSMANLQRVQTFVQEYAVREYQKFKK